MSSTVPSAWIRFLLAHRELVEELDRRLRAAHGLSLREYEVLLALDSAPRRRLRRVDLAQRLVVTQSGVTRLLDGLERDGLVTRAPGEDRRVTYAVLTDAGRRRARAAGATHRGDVDELFTRHLGARDLASLDRILARLPGGAGEGAWR